MKLKRNDKEALKRRIKRADISPEDLIEKVYSEPGFKSWWLARHKRLRQCGS